MNARATVLRAIGFIGTVVLASSPGWVQADNSVALPPESQVATVDEEDLPDVPPERGAVYARLRHFEGGISLRREDQAVGENVQLAVNSPLVPGDQFWTGQDGRAEIELADGNLLRIDVDSRVSFLNLADRAGAFDSTTLVRVLNGSLYVRADSFDPRQRRFQIDTPSGSVFLLSGGVFRVDVAPNGVSTLSSVRGVAEILGEDVSVMAHSGERVTAEPNRRPSDARAFNTMKRDPFDAWSESRDDLATGNESARGPKPEVPEPVAPYVSELSRYGAWRYDNTYGWIWIPDNVSSDWRPYYDGAWTYTPVGMTWVGYEPWGWAPYHYGRWGWGIGLGWYWIPGFTYAGAYVSWSIGPSYFGWCPMGYYDYPVYYGGYYPWMYVPYNAIYYPYVHHHAYSWSDVARHRFHENQVVLRGQPYVRPGYKPEEVGQRTYKRALSNPGMRRADVGSRANKTPFKANDERSWRRAAARQLAPEAGASPARQSPMRNPGAGKASPGRLVSPATPGKPTGYRPGASGSGGARIAPIAYRSQPRSGSVSPVTGRPMKPPVTVAPPISKQGKGLDLTTPRRGPVMKPGGNSPVLRGPRNVAPANGGGRPAPPASHPRVAPGKSATGGSGRPFVMPSRPAGQGPRPGVAPRSSPPSHPVPVNRGGGAPKVKGSGHSGGKR